MITEGDSFILCTAFCLMCPGSSCSDIQGHIPLWARSPPHGSRRGHARGAASEGGSGRSLQSCPCRWGHRVLPKAVKSETRLCGDQLSCAARQTQHTQPREAHARPPQECSTRWPRGGAVEEARVRLRLNSRQMYSIWPLKITWNASFIEQIFANSNCLEHDNASFCFIANVLHVPDLQCPFAPRFLTTAKWSPFSKLWASTGRQLPPAGPMKSERRRFSGPWKTPPTEKRKRREAGGPVGEEEVVQRRGKSRERSGWTLKECSRRKGCWGTIPALVPAQVRPRLSLVITI